MVHHLLMSYYTKVLLCAGAEQSKQLALALRKIQFFGMLVKWD